MSKVLAIEDNDIMLRAIRNILKKDGHEVITAKDGREGLDKIDNEEYDVVVTDLMMPYANGLDVVSRLRSKTEKNHIGIIVCSSISNEDTITEAFRLGADDYLKKPIVPNTLTERVRQLLAARSHMSQLVTKRK